MMIDRQRLLEALVTECLEFLDDIAVRDFFEGNPTYDGLLARLRRAEPKQEDS